MASPNSPAGDGAAMSSSRPRTPASPGRSRDPLATCQETKDASAFEPRPAWMDDGETVQEESDTNDAWSCPICLGWFDMPVSPPCQHSFCAECLKSVVRTAASRRPRNGSQPQSLRPVCPLCREMIAMQWNLHMIVSAIYGHLMQCLIICHGVPTSVIREAFDPVSVAPNDRIFQEMVTATVACRNENCTARFCPLRWKHHQETCPAAIVQCAHQVLGCAWKGVRRSLEDHMESCAYEKIKGLVPRVSGSLRRIHTQVNALEARVMAQNVAAANLRAFVMRVHQRERRASVFWAMYALLWRPLDYRRYTCPNPSAVLSNATLMCLAPVALLALRGSGVFGSHGSAVEQVLSMVGVAALGFSAFLEYDNSSPWYELRNPPLLGKTRIGPTLLKVATASTVYLAIKSLPEWKRVPALVLLLAPLTYPTVVQGIQRLQVKVKNAHSAAQRAQAHPSVPPARETTKASPVKVHGAVLAGAVRGASAVLVGYKPVLAGQALSAVTVWSAAAIFGPEKLKFFVDKWRDKISAGLPDEEKEHLLQLLDRFFVAMEAPFARLSGLSVRGCLAAACMGAIVFIVVLPRFDAEAIVSGVTCVALLDFASFRWELSVGRWVMASLGELSNRLSPASAPAQRPSLELIRSRTLVLWVVMGSVFFAMAVVAP